MRHRPRAERAPDRQEATAALLWAACRPEPDAAGVERAIGLGADLARAAEAAVAQRVSGLLWRVLRGRAEPDPVWVTELAADAARCRAQALLLGPRVANRLLGPLARAGIAPVVFKGAALAGRYPAVGLRAMDDIDLLLPKELHAEALAVLAPHGWSRTARPGSHYDVVVTHPELPGLPVELHHGLTTRRERTSRLSLRHLWNARRPQEVEGVVVAGLPPEYELVALAAHAAKPYHTFERLAWSVDLAVVLEAARRDEGDIDWEQVRDLAERTRTRTALAVALQHAQRLGCEVPARLAAVDTAAVRRRDLGIVLGADWPVRVRDQQVRYRLAMALIDAPDLVARRVALELAAEGPAQLPGRLADLTRRSVRHWRTP